MPVAGHHYSAGTTTTTQGHSLLLEVGAHYTDLTSSPSSRPRSASQQGTPQYCTHCRCWSHPCHTAPAMCSHVTSAVALPAPEGEAAPIVLLGRQHGVLQLIRLPPNPSDDAGTCVVHSVNPVMVRIDGQIERNMHATPCIVAARTGAGSDRALCPLGRALPAGSPQRHVPGSAAGTRQHSRQLGAGGRGWQPHAVCDSGLSWSALVQRRRGGGIR